MWRRSSACASRMFATPSADVMTADLGPYPAYKDSGVEWLGEVPSHWEVRQLGRIGRFMKGGGGTKEDERESGVPCVRYGDLYTQHQFFITATRACVAPELANTVYTPIRYGDVLFAGSGETIDEIGKSAVNLIPGPACCGGDVIIFRPSIDADARFLGYAMDCAATARQKACIGRGFTVVHIYSSDLKHVTVAIPSLPEQAAIARFLDHADRCIRRYIHAKQRLIALLEEQRQAIIQRAVTGEIDFRTGQRYATYKSADVEGLKEAPAHWSIVALKRMLTDIVDCEHKTAPAVTESEYHVVRTSAVRGGALDWNGTYRTDSSSYAEWTRRGEPRPGDVIFTREAPAGEACLVPTGRHVCLGQRTVLLRPDPTRYEPSFLIYMIYGGPPKVRVQLASQGSTVGHFNVDDIGWMPVLVPPLTEQQEIVAVLESHDRKVYRARRSLECELKLFHEHHRRLVADVIAGKLDVREAAAELPEIDPLGTDDALDGGNATGDGSNSEGEVAASDLDDYGSFARDERGDPGAQRAQP